jgi:hypothetical protein
MAKVAIKYHPAIDDITANKPLKLHKFELDDDDWKIITDLLRVLKVYIDTNHLLQIYKNATLFSPHDQVSTIANVIPTNCIDSLLSNTPAESLSPSVKHALTFARKSINKYYSKTDLSNVYRIAMGMLITTSR